MNRGWWPPCMRVKTLGSWLCWTTPPEPPPSSWEKTTAISSASTSRTSSASSRCVSGASARCYLRVPCDCINAASSGLRSSHPWRVRSVLCVQDVEANTVRLEEHGKSVLVLEKSAAWAEQPGAGNNSKWESVAHTHTHVHVYGAVKSLDSAVLLLNTDTRCRSCVGFA